MKNLRLKWVGTVYQTQRRVRLFRVMWEHGRVGDGKGYSTKLSIGLFPKFFHRDDGCMTVLFVRVHYRRSWGGIFV
jgi:hypothetical protein